MRVSVVGNTGSGKSTVASRIAARAGISHLELDALKHQAGWRQLPDDELVGRVRDFLEEHASWVIDGNYAVVQPLIWERADTVVWLRTSRLRTMLNVVARTIRRVVTRETLWNGNRERWANLLSLDPEESVIAWAWAKHRAYEERYARALRDPAFGHLGFVVLEDRRQADEWLRAIASPRDRP